MYHNRFYDQDPVVAQAVRLLMVLPNEVQTLTAECLTKIAESDYQLGKSLQDTRTLGSDKIMALYKSKEKKRSYDSSPAMHRAMNYLMLMPIENRRILSHRIVGLVGHLQEYLRSCKKFCMIATYQQMGEVAVAYMHRGSTEANHLIQAMELQGFRGGYNRKPGEILPAVGEFIAERNIGLQIRGNQRKRKPLL